MSLCPLWDLNRRLRTSLDDPIVVFPLIVEPEIPSFLFAQLGGVLHHVNNILGKLDVNSRLEAVTYSIRNGLG